MGRPCGASRFFDQLSDQYIALHQSLPNAKAVILTQPQITQLAPDAGTLGRGKKLATTRKWRELQGTPHCLWGECKSSGAAYYRVAVDLRRAQPVPTCNCPVRQRFCKHAIALLLLSVQQPDAFVPRPVPENWVEDWLGGLSQKADKGRPRSAADEARLAEARLVQRQKRLGEMRTGLRDLREWLNEIATEGLAATQEEADYWQHLSVRLVDAKLGGLGKRALRIEQAMRGNDWPDRILRELGEVYLIARGFERLYELPEPLQHELLNEAGLNYKKEEILDQPGVLDTWTVVGRREGQSDDEQLFWRRIWLYGENTRQLALLLDFAFGAQPYDTRYPFGSSIEGEVHFYPAAHPQRALVGQHQLTEQAIFTDGYPNLDGLMEAYAAAVANNPWLVTFPALLEDVTPVYDSERSCWWVVDRDGYRLPLRCEADEGWTLLAISGGHPITLMATYDGRQLAPLSVIDRGHLTSLLPLKPLPRPKRAFYGYG